MNPAFSVIFLTTLIGAGQGLFFALYLSELLLWLRWINPPPGLFYPLGSAIGLVFMLAGLLASFFHLGHPERAWRSAAMWRTSWLSREVIVLPLTMLALALYGLLHFLQGPEVTPLTFWIGAVGSGLSLILFICTGMIYACLRFLQEWASWLTVVNYWLLGSASGFLLATAYAAFTYTEVAGIFAYIALVSTLLAAITRGCALIRNRQLRPRSSAQTTIGVRHRRVVQLAQGFMGGSFNTREFFHGKSAGWLRWVKWIFLLLTFAVPAVILLAVSAEAAPGWLLLAFVIQYIGLLFERWYFFADANHPQNIYYQAIT